MTTYKIYIHCTVAMATGLHNDGALDGNEAAIGSDPNLADTDGDGFNDAVEGGSGGPDLDGDEKVDAIDHP